MSNAYTKREKGFFHKSTFKSQELVFPGYEIIDTNKRHVYKVKYKDDEFAYNRLPSDTSDDGSFLNLITILKELHNWQNIIKFYGITDRIYLVSEWAEYGNLREFYINNKDLFSTKLKLRIALDIACGLNILRTVEVR